MRAFTEFELRFQLGDGKTPIAGLEPYLGAWAHAAIVGEKLSSFAHLHPFEEGGSTVKLSEAHVHTPESLGPAPKQVRILTSFMQGGLYKLWLQFQVAGKVETVPFVLKIAPPEPVEPKPLKVPKDAIFVYVGAKGFDPPRVFIPQDKATTFIFLRSAEPNCANKIVFPDLGITRDIPFAGNTIIELPPQGAGELRFTCGMGMYRGSIVVVRPPEPE